jgi:hypothetical protein
MEDFWAWREYSPRGTSDHMSKSKKVTVKKVREFRPHAQHMHAARLYYNNAQSKMDGSFFQLVGSLAFCAFGLEAYLNHVGERTLDYWEDVDFAPPLAKLRLLAAEFSVPLDKARRPMQTVCELIRHRNWLVHSRSEIIKEEKEHNSDTYSRTFYDQPLHRWEAFVTPENVGRAIEDVEALIELLNSKSPKPEPLPLTLGGHSGGTG